MEQERNADAEQDLSKPDEHDLLEVFVRVERIGTTSITYDQAAYRAGDDLLMATAKATLVCIALDERKAVPVPQAFRDQIESFQEEGAA